MLFKEHSPKKSYMPVYKRMNAEDQKAIHELIADYFLGLHHADVNKLGKIFHPDCVLKAPRIRRDLNTWFDLILTRDVPAEIGAPFDYAILNMEIEGDQAMVKVACPLLGNHYIDYLGLLKEGSGWLIVSKMYADNPSINSSK